MVSAFFHFQHTLNRLYKVILILDKFFLKYEGGIKLNSPKKKLHSKHPALLGLKLYFTKHERSSKETMEHITNKQI